MSSAREEILDRVRRALGDGHVPPPVQRTYRRDSTAAGTEAVDLLTERLIDYRASVAHCSDDEVPARVAATLDGRAVDSVAVPEGFPPEWLAMVGPSRQHRDPLTADELDSLGGTVSTCAVAIAETGTIVLDAGPGQGRRALSLIPDYLLVVVRAEQIVGSVPAAVAALDATRPLTWISGPSATSDIELQRVEGVHGPRTLDVLIVTGG